MPPPLHICLAGCQGVVPAPEDTPGGAKPRDGLEQGGRTLRLQKRRGLGTIQLWCSVLSQEETAQRRESAAESHLATEPGDAGASPSNAVNRPRPTSLVSENEHGHPEPHAYRGRYPFQQEYADLKQLRHNPLEKHIRTRAPSEGGQQQEATEARQLQLSTLQSSSSQLANQQHAAQQQPTTAAPASAEQGGHRQTRAASSAFDAAAASLAVSRSSHALRRWRTLTQSIVLEGE